MNEACLIIMKLLTLASERNLPCHSKTVYFGTVKETYLVIAKQAVRLLQGWGLGFSDSGLSHTHINGAITRAV